MELSLIVTVADNGVIGDSSGAEPWDLPADAPHFRSATLGHTILMGRRTYEKWGAHPLKDRRNIVITGQKDFEAPGCEVAESLEAALELARDDGEVMVVGGGALYEKALPSVQTLYLTEVHTSPAGDVFFRFDPGDFAEIERQDFAAEDDHPAYSFVTYKRQG